MSWLGVWDNLKNKTCRYLLQRYLGQFLDKKIELEHLKIELCRGKATVKNVILNIETLNELFEAQGWSVEVIGGHIGELTVQIPWNALMTNNSSIEVNDLTINLRPTERQCCDGTSMLESMWSSVSSSMQLAEDIIKQELENTDKASTAIDGLEKFAETIDNVLNRITAKFTNTVIKFEHQLPDSTKSIGLTINLQDFHYKNETGCEIRTTKDIRNYDDGSNDESEIENKHFVSTFAKHNISFSGVTLSSDEFCNQEKQKESENRSIPIIAIKDQQKIVVRVKQSEEVSGPKILLDAELGAIGLLLTPRQVHLLLTFWNAFNEQEHTACNSENQSAKQIALRTFSENMEAKKTHMTGVLNTNTGAWGETIENICLTKDFNSAADKCDMARRTFKYCDSLYSSISSNSTMTSTARFQRKLANMETCGEIVKFNIRIASCSLNLLHEDILFESYQDGILNDCSVSTLLQISQEYFKTFLEENLRNQWEIPNALKEKNFIHLRVNPVILDGIQQRNKQVLLFKLSATAAKLDFSEISEGNETLLLAFDREENCAEGYHKRPELTINLKSTSCNMDSLSDINVDIVLEQCVIDLDISIYDRLSGLLGTSQFLNEKNVPSHNETKNVDKNLTKSSTQFNITSNLLDLNVRFPIVDVRPIHDPRRVLWWRQNVREDFLQIKLIQFRLKFSLTLIELFMNEVEVLYCENKTNKLELLRSFLAKNETNTDQCPELECPRISINLHPQPKCAKDNSVPMHENLPFSSERICRQSDTVHKRRDFAEAETVLLPGDTEELNLFRDATIESSLLHIQIVLPNVVIILQSKQIYETIYNRLNYNLFLWEPSSPLLNQGKQEMASVYESLFNLDLSESIYKPSKMSNICIDESENECDSDSDETNRILKDEHNLCSKTEMEKSTCSFELVVPKGKLTVYVPVRDTEQHVLPEQSGRFDFFVEGFQLFSVSGFKENKNLDYLFFQTESLEMFHCGLIPESCSKVLESIQDTLPEYMNATIYKLPVDLIKGDGCGSSKRKTASIVIEIKKLPEQKIKRVRATAGLQNIALRHNTELASHTWLNQLIDFLDVQDVVIEGYQPYGVLTEMQLHLWDWAIDYRPKNFPFRAVIEIGTFTISSNIISSINGCNLRFIVEESVLSIGPYSNQNDCQKQKNIINVLSSKDIVPVLDLGLLDISLRLSDKTCKNFPKFDLRCSIHDANLRTCADSGKALAQLICYIASDGDFSDAEDYEIDSMPSSSFSENSNDILESKTKATESVGVTEKQQERVEFMMAEAVQDTVKTSFNKQSLTSDSSSSSSSPKKGFEVFYFPDEGSKLKSKKKLKRNSIDEEIESSNEVCDILNFESSVMTNTYYTKTTELEDTSLLVKQELGDIKTIKTEHHSEEEYCFLSEDESIFKHRGAPSLPISNEPLRIVDNHFRLPIDNQTDLLKTPDNFPMAETRYTICEMTFTWHLYGGKDFPEKLSQEKQKLKNTNSRMSEAYKFGVAYSKNANNIKLVKEAKEKPSWKTIGGENRDHRVLVEVNFSKVRFCHEIYPLTTSHASRQVFIVNEIEIRDRLQSSEINKFLYHPNVNNLSNRSTQHMLVIKALHVRSDSSYKTSPECSLRISLLPLRLHIDQDTLIFLTDYFSNLGDVSSSYSENVDAKTTNSGSNKTGALEKSQNHPVMTVEDIPEAVQDLRARNMVSTNLELLMDNTENNPSTIKDEMQTQLEDISSPIYFREVIFSPEVTICIDYHGRRVELSRGPIAGLLMGLGQLQCSEIRLRKIVYRRGLLGVDKLLMHLCKEWLKDIKKNQLPKILSGVGPTYAFVQLFQGIYDLFWMPFEQYQKDGRLIRGLQLGAQSFTARTLYTALEITSRIIQLLQFTAETAFDLLSPGPSVHRYGRLQKGKKRKRPNRPKDIREGVTNAYLIVKEGINDSAATLIETAAIEHDQRGYTGAVGAVIRQIPQNLVRPAVLATQAATNILGGVKNSLVPEAKIEAREKWKGEND